MVVQPATIRSRYESERDTKGGKFLLLVNFILFRVRNVTGTLSSQNLPNALVTRASNQIDIFDQLELFILNVLRLIQRKKFITIIRNVNVALTRFSYKLVIKYRLTCVKLYFHLALKRNSVMYLRYNLKNKKERATTEFNCWYIYAWKYVRNYLIYFVREIVRFSDRNCRSLLLYNIIRIINLPLSFSIINILFSPNCFFLSRSVFFLYRIIYPYGSGTIVIYNVYCQYRMAPPSCALLESLKLWNNRTLREGKKLMKKKKKKKKNRIKTENQWSRIFSHCWESSFAISTDFKLGNEFFEIHILWLATKNFEKFGERWTIPRFVRPAILHH